MVLSLCLDAIGALLWSQGEVKVMLRHLVLNSQGWSQPFTWQPLTCYLATRHLLPGRIARLQRDPGFSKIFPHDLNIFHVMWGPVRNEEMLRCSRFKSILETCHFLRHQYFVISFDVNIRQHLLLFIEIDQWKVEKFKWFGCICFHSDLCQYQRETKLVLFNYIRLM